MLPKVLGEQPRLFDMQTFVADKAYSSRAIFQFLYDLGLSPHIPFKSNATGTTRGCPIWSKMYREFRTKQEEFLTKYHARSNIETCFHMLKQRFGERLLTKNFTANQNELLVRMLCHNLCVLIQEVYERDIHIDWNSCIEKASCPEMPNPIQK